MAEGKRLLMQVAVRQAREKGSTRTLVLRELAREAGLNHNTFYRHFDDLENMFEAIIADYTGRIREGVRRARESVVAGSPPSRVVLGWLFDFARQEPDVFVVAMREMHGPPGPIRDAVRAVFELVVDDMVGELTELGHLPSLGQPVLRRLLRVQAAHAFNLCNEYLEAPQRRAELLESAQELFEVLVAGALARERRRPPGRASVRRSGRRPRA